MKINGQSDRLTILCDVYSNHIVIVIIHVFQVVEL